MAEDPPSSSKQPQALTLTVNRIKAMIKDDIEVKTISTEACFAIAKATEQLIDEISKRAGSRMLTDKRNTLEYNDVSKSVAEWEALDFLEEIVPLKITAAEALARMEAKQTNQ